MTADRKSIQSQLQRLARNAVALVFGGIAAQLAFTLLEILVARKLGAEAYGVFVTAYAWTVLGAFVIEFGTPLWTIQEGSRDHSKLPVLLGSAITLNVVLFSILYLLLVVVATWLVQNPVLSFLLVLLPYGLILTTQNALAAVYSSYQTMHVNAFFQGMAPVAILLAYFAFSANDLVLADVGVAYLVGGGIVTGAWFCITARKVAPKFSVRRIGATMRSSYHYGLTGVLGQVWYKADVVMLSAIAGLREAGIYAAAFKLVEIVSKVSVLGGRVFAPALFKASHESTKAYDVFSSMMIRFLALIGLVAGIVTFLLAEDLILLTFGDNYLASAPVLRILGGVMATRCMLVALQLVLSSIDLHAERVRGLGITVVAHIAANAVLIPRFGAQGAAWATLFSGALIILLYAFSASRKRDFKFIRWILVPSAVGVTVAFAGLLTGVNVFISAAVAATVFLVTLFLTGFIRPDEVVFVLRSVLGNRQHPS